MIYKIRVHSNDFYKDYTINVGTVKEASRLAKEKFMDDLCGAQIVRVQLLNFVEHSHEIIQILVGG